MIKVDLITGFLGSGKTTFIREYVRHLNSMGLKTAVIENDFGAVNVDMMLLQDILSDSCDLEMVPASYDSDCHRRRFKTKLISMGMRGFDRVIVEPSGIYDVEEFFDILHESPLDSWYEIGSVIAVADGIPEDNLSLQAEGLLGTQAASAGIILLSRCQLAEDSEIQHTISNLEKAVKKLKCGHDIKDRIIAKDWSLLDGKDYSRIMNCGHFAGDYEKPPRDDTKAFSSEYFMNYSISPSALKQAAEEILSDKSFGNVIRIKGFTSSEEGWYELNATRKSTVMKPIANGQQIVIVIGEGLDKAALEKYLHEKEFTKVPE